MIYVNNTPNNTGVAVYGDFMDYENLYESLHTVVGHDEEFVSHYTARIRVLGVCYDLRHAMLGDREAEFVDNGMDYDKKQRMSILAPDKNLYLKINVLWPELLFVMMALNDFILLYARKKLKIGYDIMLDKANVWDQSIAAVRFFQAAVSKCIKETVTDASFSRIMNNMNTGYTTTDHYTRQYLDVLNCRYIAMSPEKRLASISIMVKRIAERGEEYKRLTTDVKAAAKYYNTYEDNIKPPVEYPGNFEW